MLLAIVLVIVYLPQEYLAALLPVQSLDEKKEDEKVKSLFEQYFPERKVIQINPLGLNYNGGRMYCWSRQVPEKEK